MRNLIILIAIAIIMPSAVQAQKLEVGVFGGFSNYQGDLAPIAFTLREFHPAGGALIRYNWNKFVTFRVGATYGSVSGDDGKTVVEWRHYRNLSFKTHVAELAGLIELHWFGFEDCGPKNFSPYFFGGLAVYNFNPKTQYGGQWVDLQPLGTEGQGTSIYPEREKYKLTQLSIPFGVGIKYRTPLGINIGAEIGWRKLWTDYLDDVSLTYVNREILVAENGELSYLLSNRSGEVLPTQIDRKHGEQRGDPTDMDWYFFGGIILSHTFGPKCYDRSGVGCPSF